MAGQAGRDVRININKLESNLRNMLLDNFSMSPRRCIFKVPNILSRHNPKAYKPNAFSIGPFHSNNDDLKATQKIKVKYLHDLISRCFPYTDPETKLRELAAAISEVLEEALECYAGGIDDMPMDEFVKVLVLDGCFLIELFRKSVHLKFREDDDPIFTNCMRVSLSHDLILLENQIPWLVLERLFEMTKTQEDRWPLNILAIACFHDIFLTNLLIPYELMKSLTVKQQRNKHILDLLRNSIVQPSSIASDNNWFFKRKWARMPSATSLRESGIKFKKAESRASILDIEFKDGVLEIPQLYIHESTESLLRNLICLEQCLPNCDGIITSYAILLDHLIDTPKDTVILSKNEVIYNRLDIEDATKFFNQLYHGTDVISYSYLNLINEVNKHCERRWPRYRRALMRDYLKHPWAVTSLIVAAVLLLLTFLQTVFAIIE